MNIEDDLLLSPKEAADFTGFHYRTILRMIEDGEIPAKNFNKKGARAKWRILKSDLKKVFKQKTK